MDLLPGAFPINVMADWELSQWGFTQICVARGTVSCGSGDDTAGELRLWYRERDNEYCIYARGNDMVCKVIDVFTLRFQKCPDKIKTLLMKKSKFHFVQY